MPQNQTHNDSALYNLCTVMDARPHLRLFHVIHLSANSGESERSKGHLGSCNWAKTWFPLGPATHETDRNNACVVCDVFP